MQNEANKEENESFRVGALEPDCPESNVVFYYLMAVADQPAHPQQAHFLVI